MVFQKGHVPFNKKSDELKEEEVKTEAKPEVKAREPKAEPQRVLMQSELDVYISDRMKEQPSSIEEVQAKDIFDPRELPHRLKLNKKVEEAMEKRGMSARWVFKSKKAIDHALNVIGWTIVNKVYFPELEDYHFTANGSIEVGDSILAFMPKKHAEKIRLRPAEISRERVKSTPAQDLRKWEQRAEHHYKPDSGVSEDGAEIGGQPRGIVLTPDDRENWTTQE